MLKTIGLSMQFNKPTQSQAETHSSYPMPDLKAKTSKNQLKVLTSMDFIWKELHLRNLALILRIQQAKKLSSPSPTSLLVLNAPMQTKTRDLVAAKRQPTLVKCGTNALFTDTLSALTDISSRN